MEKRMFSRFSSILQHAVDALSPHLSLQEEFVYHWKAVTSYFIDSKGEKVPVEQTIIPAHLEQMLVILQEEETTAERGMYGPCLEYLLQHKLLETLYSLGRTDFPAGMKQMVLSFFTKLLSRIKQPLLPHVNVHKAVHRLVKACGEVKAAPTEIEEIQFLCTVCAKIKTDPYLVNFFLDVPKSSPGETKSVEDVAGAGVVHEFSLVNTLLTLSQSADSRVAVKACEGLMLCASLPETIAAQSLIHKTCFCSSLTQNLVDTYTKLPEVVNPVDLEHVQAKWGMDVVTEREDQQTFLGKRHLVSFLSWLDYCDQLVSIANPLVGQALSQQIRREFLVTCFQPSLLQVSETGVISATAYLTRCLRTVCSPHLLREFVYFICGEARGVEVSGEAADSVRARLIDRCNHVSEEVCLVTLQLFDTLLQKNDEHILHNLVLRNFSTRGYFDSYFNDKTQALHDSEQSGHIDVPNNPENPITANTKESHKCQENKTEVATDNSCHNDNGDASAILHVHDDDISNKPECHAKSADSKESGVQHDSGENVDPDSQPCESKETSEEHTRTDQLDEASSLPTDSQTTQENGQSTAVLQESVESTSGDSVRSFRKQVSSVSSGMLSDDELSPVSSPGHVRTEVHKIVNSFLSLLPEELKSSYQTADSGYDMYLRDAHKQYSDVVAVCKPWGYPHTSSHAVPVVGDQDTDMFYEGAFLHMLLDKLSHMLDQSYSINLQLTSVVSKLALVPHPHLHEFLLDPHLPLKNGLRNLFAVFQKVSHEIKSQFEAEPDLSQRLILARRQLMGASPNIQRARLEVVQNTRFDGQGQLEAIIVLEEFCKELSAIAFVKHHAAVTGDTGDSHQLNAS